MRRNPHRGGGRGRSRAQSEREKEGITNHQRDSERAFREGVLLE